VGSVKETNLTPEGQSSLQVFQYLSAQLEKIYAVFAAMSDCPLGALLIHVYFFSIWLFDTGEDCDLCKKKFNQIAGEGFGLIPNLFRDFFMRPEFLSVKRHYMCLTCQMILSK